ncbi:UDP-Glycosyltransferase/glycogen phosphorylase, partial [Microstroma glucosiphilum]
IVSDFFYPNLGGVEGHISEISALLVAPPFNHHVVIITHAYAPSRIGVRHLSTGVTVYYLPLKVIASQATLPNFFTSHPLLRYIFIRERIQLVHAHQALSSLAHEALFHAREAGIKTVFTDHSLFSLDEDAASILTNKLLRFVLSDVDRVVCVSYAARENTVLRAGIRDPGRRVVVIPNAVDGEKFKPLTLKEQSTRSTTIVILSRLMYRKGIDLLIEAIPRICLAHPEVDFLIGGDGPKRVELEQMRERCLLLDRVQLVGSVKQGSVRDHLTRGEIFLSPSLTEAFGTSLIEAASCGLLIVATEVGGVPEILPSPEMLLLAAPNTDELVRVVSLAVHRVRTQLESGDWDPWAVHARTRGMYSWSEVVRRLEGVYFEAMRERRVSRMERLMRYWDNAGPETGGVFCIVVMVDMVFAWLLEWGWPKADIDVVLPVAPGVASETASEEEEEAHVWNGDEDRRGRTTGND